MKHAPREHQRVYLTFYLRIFEGDKFLGFLIDFSKDGLMLMSEFPLKEEKFYDLKMKVPSSFEWKGKNDEDKFIDCTARCIWSKHDEVEKEFYLNGFEFSDLSDEDDAILHRLLEEYRIK